MAGKGPASFSDIWTASGLMAELSGFFPFLLCLGPAVQNHVLGGTSEEQGSGAYWQRSLPDSMVFGEIDQTPWPADGDVSGCFVAAGLDVLFCDKIRAQVQGNIASVSPPNVPIDTSDPIYGSSMLNLMGDISKC